MKKLLIFGAGGFGCEAFTIAKDVGYSIVGFVDSKCSESLPALLLGSDHDIEKIIASHKDVMGFVAIGNSLLRKKVSEDMKNKGIEIVSLVHPTSLIAEDVSIGEGAIIYPNVTIMNSSKISKGALINSNVSIGHDVCVGEFSNVNLGANLAGCVQVGDCTLIGMGANVIEGNRIGNDVTIGAGAVVTKNLIEKGVYLGIPAIKRGSND
ncbi:MAG: NeuD/PglB/VioB family sugar acetyltransferase [Bacteriovoracaceae bacterium]|jgi:sugar O-acyltransferase (sialic acid O-acetyltransferase NeuD family)|nr:NeuD/PglB/VioB family sugar acetyltransferase [Bacteriovoracaceae bacterium]